MMAQNAPTYSNGCFVSLFCQSRPSNNILSGNALIFLLGKARQLLSQNILWKFTRGKMVRSIGLFFIDCIEQTVKQSKLSLTGTDNILVLL